MPGKENYRDNPLKRKKGRTEYVQQAQNEMLFIFSQGIQKNPESGMEHQTWQVQQKHEKEQYFSAPQLVSVLVWAVLPYLIDMVRNVHNYLFGIF